MLLLWFRFIEYVQFFCKPIDVVHLVLLSFVDGGHGVDGEANGLAMWWRRRSSHFYNGIGIVHVDDILRYMCCSAVLLLDFRAVSF